MFRSSGVSLHVAKLDHCDGPRCTRLLRYARTRPDPVESDVPQSASHPSLEQQMTSDQPAPVRAELALRHRDMDALGHVNQAVYHELLEEVRAAFFRHTLPDLPFTGYVLVHVELDYRREGRIQHRHLIGEGRLPGLGCPAGEVGHPPRLPRRE